MLYTFCLFARLLSPVDYPPRNPGQVLRENYSTSAVVQLQDFRRMACITDYLHVNVSCGGQKRHASRQAEAAYF